MRVLYLAPPGRRADQLSRYSFLDEEIRALAQAGVQAYVISTAVAADGDDGPIHMRVPPAESWRERQRALRFLAGVMSEMPVANLLHMAQCYRSVREERFAAEVIRSEGIDLIHSFFARPLGFGGVLAKAATGVPLVAGLRGVDVNTLPRIGYGSTLDPFFRRAVQRLLRSADATVSVSEFVRRDALALGARPDASRVILKGVRLDNFQPSQDRQQAHLKVRVGPEPLLLAVGGLIDIKGFNHVLDALAIVRAAGARFTFVVCGEGPNRAALEEQASALDLADCCQFRGKVARAEISRYFAAADVFVHGALIEGSGNVLVEAMACAVPVVCTDAGGPAEYVKNGITGFVVPVGDPPAMADKLLLLLRDAQLRSELSLRARQHAVASFDYGRMINETLAVYRDVINVRSAISGPAARATQTSPRAGS